MLPLRQLRKHERVLVEDQKQPKQGRYLISDFNQEEAVNGIHLGLRNLVSLLGAVAELPAQSCRKDNLPRAYAASTSAAAQLLGPFDDRAVQTGRDELIKSPTFAEILEALSCKLKESVVAGRDNELSFGKIAL